MAIQYRAPGSSGNDGTTAVSSMTTTLPAGWQPGDLLFLVVRLGSSAVTAVAQNTGTGTWTIDYQGGNGAANVYYIFGHRLMQAGDTAPGFSWATATTRSCYSCGGFYSDAGGTLTLDKYATGDPLAVTAAATTATPNAVTAAGTEEASIILTCCRASAASSATSHAYTPPAGWTYNDGDASFSAATLNARFAANAYKLGVSGTVTPAHEDLTDSTSDTFYWFVVHALVSETVTASESGPNYAGAAADLGGGSGTWASASNATGTTTGTLATWAAP